MDLDQGLEVLRKCFFELKTRFIVAQPNFTIKVVDKDGYRTIQMPNRVEEEEKMTS